jgi:uncharacterized protein YggL (DUF469 family)
VGGVVLERLPHHLALHGGELQTQYNALVSRHGVGQLTTVEREVVRQALEDYAAHDYPSLDKSLKDAEVAIQAAQHRLNR